MCKLDEILARRDEVNALARKNRAGRMFVFGSCARKLDDLTAKMTAAKDSSPSSPPL